MDEAERRLGETIRRLGERGRRLVAEGLVKPDRRNAEMRAALEKIRARDRLLRAIRDASRQ